MKRALAILISVLTLIGLTASVASSSTPDRAVSPVPSVSDKAPANGKGAVQVGPDSSCTYGGITIVCEYGVSQFYDADIGDWHYFVVRASDLVAYHSWCSSSSCLWYAIPGATAHSGISATLYQTGMLIAFRYASTEIKWLCHWYSFENGKWGTWYFCG